MPASAGVTIADGPMISVPFRAACAGVALLLFLGGVAGLVAAPSAWFLVPIFAAAFLAVPAMFGGKRPEASDLPRIESDLRRFSVAMLLCFTGAVISARAGERLASLGVALWVVAFMLLFFVAYYRMQRRMAVQSARDAG